MRKAINGMLAFNRYFMLQSLRLIPCFQVQKWNGGKNPTSVDQYFSHRSRIPRKIARWVLAIGHAELSPTSVIRSKNVERILFSTIVEDEMKIRLRKTSYTDCRVQHSIPQICCFVLFSVLVPAKQKRIIWPLIVQVRNERGTSGAFQISTGKENSTSHNFTRFKTGIASR